ncbi:MAG: pantetheine-phosphate adenylyltransferase [Pseudomonadota bacterium]|nr:pantetheine-phosphate adenylyltransferase [Pseudomonadota bacterium]
MTACVIYPGTFDPITNGHIELIKRAAGSFNKIIVAVAASPDKQPLFNLQQRINLIDSVVGSVQGVSIEGYDGLTVNFALKNKADFILRGIRAAKDFEHEFSLVSMNRNLAPNVETIFMMPSQEFMFISSTLVKEVFSLGGDISNFVHPIVLAALIDKISN